jgi:hypothetical protein
MKRTVSIAIAAVLCCAFAALTGIASDGPGIRILNSIQKTYGPVTFDHRKHVSIAGSCGTCHHEHSMGEGLPCKQCHSVTPAVFKESVSHSFLSCKSCHGDFDRDNASMPGLRTAYHVQCFTCHRGMAGIGTDPKGCSELCHEKRTSSAGTAAK